MFLRLMKAQFKQISSYGVYLVLSAFILMSVFLCLSIKADDIIYKDGRQEPLPIGIVMNPDSKFANMAYEMIRNMDSYKSSCSFEEISDKDTALKKLDNGDLYAIIYVPDNIISDIMDGTNTPVEVYYSDADSIDSFILNDLFRSTSSMLGISQAAIYSAQALGKDMGIPDDVRSALSDDVNMFFMRKVIDRSVNFTITRINATMASDTSSFYICASIIILMLLCGVVFVACRLNIPDVLVDRLRSFGIGKIYLNISSYLCIFAWEYILFATVYMSLVFSSLFIDSIHLHLSIQGLLIGVVISALAALVIIAVSLIPAGIHGCTLLLATITIVIAYVNGFFIPEAMLPNFAKSICNVSLFNRLAHELLNAIFL